VRAKQDDHKIVLYWDKRSEQSIDPVTGNNMFQGYRVYRSTDRGSTWGNVVTDLNGNPTDIYQPLAVYDIADGISGAYTMSDPLVYYDLGSESGLQYTFIDENIVNGYEYWYAVTAYDGPDNWAGALVDPMENSKAKDATITDDNTVALIPQVSPAGLDKGGVTGITHHGLSTARFDAITADPFVVQILGHSEVTLDDLKSKGFTYQVDFHETIDSIDTSSGDAEYYDTTYTRFWSLVNLDNGDTIINNESDISSEVQHVVDGFIPSFSSATWEITGEDSTVFSPVDSSSASSIIFSGLGHPSASKKTWKSYLETLPSSSIGELGVDPMVSDLWNDLELRFTNEGSIASYYNILTLYGMQEIDTVLVPFELWDIENNRQLNLAVYQSVGTSKPEGNIWALDSVIVIDSLFSSSSVVLDTSWSFGFKLKTSFQFIPGYDDYSPNEKLHYAQDTDKLGWVINLDQQNTYFNSGDIFRIHIANPLLPGVDHYIISTSSDDYILEDGDLNNIKVVPNPYIVTSVYERVSYSKEVQFTNLPSECVIRIYNTSGDMIQLLQHNPSSPGYRGPSIEAWNLGTYNNQDIAFGVYVFHVVSGGFDTGKEFIGKFAVIK
jgi:hypothetical protein